MKANLFKNVEERVKLLEKIIASADRQMPNIQGILRITHDGANTKYYHLENGARKGKYIRKDNMKLITQLAQKSYNEQMILLAQKELDCLKNLVSSYPEMTFEDYFETLSEERRKVIDPIWLPDDEYTKRWLKQKYQTKGFDSHDTSAFISNSGIRMRSKSEVNIANSLDRHKIPYIYELPRYIKGVGIVYPDFTILVPKTRKIIIWEHHGLLDDRDYRENNFLRKNAAYAENGFFPGINLIQTFESQKTPLSIPMIEKTIQTYLI